MTRTDELNPTPAELADLSALADGTLAPARVPEVQARLAADPRLARLYEQELAAVELIRRAASTDRAPAGLRARLAAERSRPRRRWVASRPLYGLLAAAAAAAIVVALVLPGGTPGGPSISQAEALALRAPTQPALPVSSEHLNARIQNLVFPNWAQPFGWQAVGQRTDTIAGREVVTVFYEWHGVRIAYSVLAAPPLAQTGSGAAWSQGGSTFNVFGLRGRTVVTWRRAGHTCVLSGAGVPASELVRLAAWA